MSNGVKIVIGVGLVLLVLLGSCAFWIVKGLGVEGPEAPTAPAAP